MQLIIKNTHIFDNKIQEEFREFIKLKKDKINASKSYKLTIIYNDASVLERDEFYFDNSIYSNVQTKDEDKKRSALRGLYGDYSPILCIKLEDFNGYSQTHKGTDINTLQDID